MTLVTRAGKGAPLSALDHDGNLTHVMDRPNHTGAQAIATVTGLQTALDGKAATSHTHIASAVTDFSEAVDDRVAALLVQGANVTLTYDDVLNTLTIAAGGGGGNTTTTTGAGAPVGAPAAATDRYIDTTNGTLYYPVGVSWVAAVGGSGANITSNATPLGSHEILGSNGTDMQVTTWDEAIANFKIVTLDASDRLVNPKAIYTSFSGGTPTAASTYTPAAADGNVQHITNDAAFTLAPPATLGSFIVEIVNGATAGVITTSGFTKVSGDALTTTNGHKFIAQITVSNSISHLNIAAGQ